MIKCHPCILVACSALLTVGHFATAWAGDLPRSVTPKSDLPLRESPPGAFFKGKGEQIGDAKKDEALRVIDAKTVPTLLGGEEWLKVQSETNPTKEGWIFSGPADSKASNVSPAPAR